MRLDDALAASEEIRRGLNTTTRRVPGTSTDGRLSAATRDGFGAQEYVTVRAARPSSVAVGIGPGRQGGHRVAVRVPADLSEAERHEVLEQLDRQRSHADLDVRAIGSVVPLGAFPVHVDEHVPKPVSGAVCCVVRHDGHPRLLSCSHVVAGCDRRPDGAAVLTSLWNDDRELGTLEATVFLTGNEPRDVALVDPSIELGDLDGRVAPLSEAVTDVDGLARPAGDEELPDDTEADADAVADDDEEILEGARVFMDGPVSGSTLGSVTMVRFGPFKVDYTPFGGGVVELTSLMEVRSGPGQHFARPGDSGSLVRDGEGRGVGMVVAAETEDRGIPGGPVTLLAPLADTLTAIGATLL